MGVTFQHVDDEGAVYGPYVEIRPGDEDLDGFVQLHQDGLVRALNRPLEKLEVTLRRQICGFADETIKVALAIDQAKVEELKASARGDAGDAAVAAAENL